MGVWGLRYVSTTWSRAHPKEISVNPLLESFLQRHRDRETAMSECCGTVIADLTMRQVQELLRVETGVKVSRQWLIPLLERLQIPRRGERGRPGDPLRK